MGSIYGADYIQGMYPTLIIFIVFLRESLVERSVRNASGLASISLHFASANRDAYFEHTSITFPDPVLPTEVHLVPQQAGGKASGWGEAVV